MSRASCADLHPDEDYKVHTSTEENIACHRGVGPAGTYGAETSDCDSPLALVDATLNWVAANLKDSIDFVVWTGDSARHDSDERLPRRNADILAMNRRIANSFVSTFSDTEGLVVPVVPTFGNNDIYPHNILMPGPNQILRDYNDIWQSFIPEAQRHTFEYGGWFFAEVIPDKLAVFSLNTMYFFDRNAGVDDCTQPSEPGYKHFEWLQVQLQFLRDRGMKAILMGHVPPARTEGKQLWDETCWQKYTLWLQQYRDVVAGSLYGHMNIDHFLLQDTHEIDLALMEPESHQTVAIRESMEEEFSVESSTDYLMELRDNWSKLPNPIGKAIEETGKKKKKHGKNKDKLGGPWAERYQLSLISPSVVPNYFPSLRVFEYNITGIEDTPTWVDTVRNRPAGGKSLVLEPGSRNLELRSEQDVRIEERNRDEKKGRGGLKTSRVGIPKPPAEDALPGPAYFPQPLTFLGFTQYYANLTYINNDIGDGREADWASSAGWNAGKHKDKKPQSDVPRPKEFSFEVEYTTFDDRIYGLQDLTVKSLLRLAHRIGQTSSSSSDDLAERFEDQDERDPPGDGLESEKKNKKKKNKNKKKKKDTEIWLHFLKHAFVSTRSIDELRNLD
ncbi:Metallo-dependent phosphatase-like protein [Durotheca rogersii]|uniref:Metallo-dependent phosphatase-like protein n=1 Tax=Durotheca rogersii TaxID=419775 RepID=UPI00221E7B39|nr:Metallo-dependent phosphatase-like protein [Durotheca rogersii]KAI5861857.1 Metallo-dependent phosphatase-like protein [Durotheca rogersii]